MLQAPARVVDAYIAALPDGDVGELDISGFDRTGVPVVATDFAGPDHRWDGVGYGVRHEQARIGGWAELAEGLLLRRELQGRVPVESSYAELRSVRGADGVVDPLTLTLPAGSAYTHEQPLHWYAATRWRTGEEVLVPAEFCASKSADLAVPLPSPPLAPMITNGAGAGDTVERAVAHALLELCQRDGNTTAFRAMDAGVVVELDDVRDQDTADTIARLAGLGIHVLPKLATTQFGMAHVHVVAHDVEPSTPALAITACGEAVHPDREAALRKAVLEYAAARARKLFMHGPLDVVADVAGTTDDYWDRELRYPLRPQEAGVLEAMREWSTLSPQQLLDRLRPTVLAQHATIAFSSLPTVPAGSLDEPGLLLGDLLDRLTDFDVLVLTAAADSAVAAKVIVPGLEAETMSHHRIGERGVARLLERGSDLVGLGEPPHEGARPVRLTPEAIERLGGTAWFDVALARRTVDGLLPLYREPDRHALGRSEVGR